ncbi:MAG TPA: hypothetical protein VKE96_15855 [Vicinamibacterales bacterium]|nr:hypothetical protein [Vicinamibacterales bacterium]
MPIAYRLDRDARVVVAVGHGVLTDHDVFDYQHGVWSRADVVGFDELIDMTRVNEVAMPSVDRVRDLAAVAASMDAAGRHSRLAIVASTDFVYGLGRMFQAHRQLDAKSTKVVGVFRTMDEALAFLGLTRPPEMPALA